jgi:putative MATE family efflux protein
VVALQNVVSYSVNVADNLMLGNYSQAALSGAATVNQIQFMVQQTIFGGLVPGMVAINAQYWGQKKLSPIRVVSGTALKVGLCFGLAVFAVTALIPRQLLGLFTSEEAILTAGLEYLSILKYTYLFYVLTTILLGALRSVETVNIAFGVSLMSLIVNVCINYTLIFGNFGAPELGIRGAAIGTLIARVLEFSVVVFYVLKADRKLRLFSEENPFRRDKQLEGDLRRVASVTTTNSVLWSLATPIQTAILGHLSADAIAANSVSTTLFQYMKVVVMGEASSSSVVVGRTLGSGITEKEQLQPYVRSLQGIYVILGLTFGGVLLALRKPLLSCYSLSPTAMELASRLILLMVVIYVFMAYQMPTGSGIIQGGGDTKFSMRLNLVSTWCIVMPLSFAGAFWWKLPVFWVVFLLNSDQIFKCVPIFLRANSYKWVRVLTRKDESP